MGLKDTDVHSIAETMARTIDSTDLLDLYDAIEFDDPVEGIADAIKTTPFVVIDFLANYIDDMWWDKRNDDIRNRRNNNG